jgi:hypothetical protein
VDCINLAQDTNASLVSPYSVALHALMKRAELCVILRVPVP